MKYLWIIFFLSCATNTSTETPSNTENTHPNILLIIMDDMGIDATPNYQVGSVKPKMPNLELLMQNGITFDNVWSNTQCSPTRATLLTGKYGFRTGVLNATSKNQIPTTETSLQTYIKQNSPVPYASAVIGKWHLSGNSNGGKTNPANMGIPHYSGFISGALNDYFNWELTTNGTTETSTEYVTTKFTDMSIDWIKQQTSPWFLWLAYTSPHTPIHLPPTFMHSQGDLPTDNASINANPLPYFLAMIESIDHEIGRLLTSMSAETKENTLILFLGDNGTSRKVIQGYNKADSKGSLKNGGILVPLIASGKTVLRKNVRESALINTTDLFSTIANTTGINATHIHDSYSFSSLFSNENTSERTFIYSETDDKIVGWALRNQTHKLIQYENGDQEFYNLTNDFYEQNNLLLHPLSDSDKSIKQQLETLNQSLKN